MGDGRSVWYKRIIVVYPIVAVIIISIVFLISYVNQNVTSANPFIYWTITYSVPISLALILISVGLGYFLASVNYSELRKTKQESRKILELLLLFLHADERAIVSHLVKHGGSSTQAELSRLPDMNRVKAFRSVQKMVEKDLVEISSHGKIRKVALKRHVFELLGELDG